MKKPVKIILVLIGLLVVLVGGTWAALRFGNPQWHKKIYMYQCYDLKINKGFPLAIPAGYSGTWHSWRDDGRIRARAKLKDGACLSSTTFDKNENPWSEADFTNPEDCVIRYFKPDGTVKKETHYRLWKEGDPVIGSTSYNPGKGIKEIKLIPKGS